MANLDIFEREKLNRNVLDNEGAVPRHARVAARPAAGRRRPRRRVLLRHRAGEGQGHPARPSTTTSRSACCAASCRKALFDAGLICRADDRGDPVIQLAPPLTCGPEPLRRDRADPAHRPHRRLQGALTAVALPPRHGAARTSRIQELAMRVGIPREIKDNEHRVAITPDGVHELVRHGVTRCSSRRAPAPGSCLDRRRLPPPPARDRRRRRGGVGQAELRAEGQGAVAAEYHLLRARPGAVHLPAPGRVPGADRRAARRRAPRRSPTRPCSCPTGSLPLLAPMSEVAGRLATQVGAPLSSAARRRPGRAARRRLRRVRRAGRRPRRRQRRLERGGIAPGMQAEVLLLDKNIDRLRCRRPDPPGAHQTLASNAYEVERAVADADLVIGAVLVPGAEAPVVVTDDMVARMKPGSGPRRHRHRPGRLLREQPATTHSDPIYAWRSRSSTASRTCPERCRTRRPTP